MPFTHVGGVAGKSGTIAMQQKIGKLRKRIAELEQVVVERNQCIRQLRTENKKLRELVHAFDWCTENFDMPSKCEHCPLSQSDALNPECEVRMRELGIEMDE